MQFTVPSRRVSILIAGALALAAIVCVSGIVAIRSLTSPADSARRDGAPTLAQVAALGRIEPRGQVINVASGIPDRLESMLVRRGEIVTKDQILAYLQSHALEVAQRSQIAAQLSAAKLKLETETVTGRARMESARIKLKSVNDVSPIRIAAQEATITGYEAELKNSRKILEANTRQRSAERDRDAVTRW